jgi:hypothetical protein
MYARLVFTLCLSLQAHIAWPIGGDVPIDSDRGAYEGADNIHWYMQDSLDYQKLKVDPPFSWEYVGFDVCNEMDSFTSCNDLALGFIEDYKNLGLQGIDLLSSEQQVTVNLMVQVDDSIAFAWRYALSHIRQVNRIFRQSRVPVTLLVSEIQSVDIRKRYGSDIEQVFDTAASTLEDMTRENEADIVLILMNPDLAVEDGDGFITCGLGSLPYYYTINLSVVTCEDTDSTILAHEIGHNFGLVHDATTREDDLDFDPSFASGGEGFLDTESGCGTIMSYSDCIIPIFSNPKLKITRDNGDEVYWGNDSVNAKQALEAAMWMIALGNEVVHGDQSSNASQGQAAQVKKYSYQLESLMRPSDKIRTTPDDARRIIDDILATRTKIDRLPPIIKRYRVDQ